MKSKLRSTLETIPAIFRYLLILGVIVFISFLFPNNAKFKYDFESGQNWYYDNLNAPFDFAIKKTEVELETEVNEIKRDFSPYYEFDESVTLAKYKEFESSFSAQLEQEQASGNFEDVFNRSEKYLEYGNDLLKQIYDKGIIELHEDHKDKGKDFVVNLLTGNVSQKRTLENLPEVEEALGVLSDELPAAPLSDPDFLLPLLEKCLVPNLLYNAEVTEKFQNELIESISPFRGMVKKGELIVPKGGIITDDIYQKLISFESAYESEIGAKKSHLGIFLGYLLLTSLIIGVFVIYLMRHFRNIFSRFHKLLFIFLWPVLYSYLVFVIDGTDFLSTYLVPFCIVPIVINTFYNGRLALFTHIIIVLIASFLSSLGYEFTFLQILAGIVVLLSDVDTRDWSKFFYSMLFIFGAYFLGFFGLSLIKEGTLVNIEWPVFTWLFISTFLTLLAYPLIPLLERFFGFTSSITLVELSDMNRPLLRDLAMNAPGTLQHSLQVANLSEEAARKIGANPLLVKVAALYHDIGKTEKPEFFIENQSGNNPHEGMPFLESAKIIIGHVRDGVEKAKKAHLPNVLIDFIKTHHGTTRVEYFYRSFVNENPDKEFDESLFRYPGPKPRTKEETIVMIADSIEAACKSLKEHTGEALDGLIEKIIQGKISHGQFDDSEMTFQELETCKSVFKKMMRSVHHVRIEYPEEKKKVESGTDKN